jgi:hypothetical protein
VAITLRRLLRALPPVAYATAHLGCIGAHHEARGPGLLAAPAAASALRADSSGTAALAEPDARERALDRLLDDLDASPRPPPLPPADDTCRDARTASARSGCPCAPPRRCLHLRQDIYGDPPPQWPDRTPVMPAAAVLQTIRRQRGALRHCYERALQARPAIAGRVTVRFVVDPAGSVVAVTGEQDTLGDPGVSRCVATVVGAIRFGERTGDAPLLVVNLPLRFEPAQR